MAAARGATSGRRPPGSKGSGTRIRSERPGDEPQIATVVEQAFRSPAHARLVTEIRASAGYVPDLSLVSESAAGVVGYVMISEASLREGDLERPVAMLSPLAVARGSQRRGIGSALVREVIERAERLGHSMVVLEGSPTFYGRLGFEPSVPRGIRLPLPPWAPPEAAQVLRLRRYDSALRGDVVLPRPFEVFSEH